MSEVKIKGSCLCGEISFVITKEPDLFQYCHCVSCQKATGSAHVANLFVPPDCLRWMTGESLIKKFKDEKTNPGFSIWFCGQCGSKIPHLSRKGNGMVVPAGSLDTPLKARPQRNIHWAEKASWYIPVENLPRHIEGTQSPQVSK